MKRYLGSYMNAYAGIMLLVFCISPIVFSLYLLSKLFEVATICFSIVCLLVSIICFIQFIKLSNRFYSWGIFSDKDILVRTFFQKSYIIEYNKCIDIGIGCYVHGILNSSIGSRVKYIYLSYSVIDPKYKYNINLLPITTTFVKVGYSEKLYNYLIDVLPEKQSRKLKRSKEEFEKTGDG